MSGTNAATVATPAQMPSTRSPRSSAGSAGDAGARARSGARSRTRPRRRPAAARPPRRRPGRRRASRGRRAAAPATDAATTRSMRSEACSESRSGTTTADFTSASICSSRRWSSASAARTSASRGGPGLVQQVGQARQRLGHARAVACAESDATGKPEPARQAGGVDLDAEALRLVGHVEEHERRHAQRLHLQGERQLPVHLGGVEHHDDRRRRARPRGSGARPARRRRSRAGRRGRAGRPARPCGRRPARGAVARSTVTPGQLPTRACEPVRRLKSVDLPVLGMPISATRFMGGPARARRRRFLGALRREGPHGAQRHAPRLGRRAGRRRSSPGARAAGREGLRGAARPPPARPGTRGPPGAAGGPPRPSTAAMIPCWPGARWERGVRWVMAAYLRVIPICSIPPLMPHCTICEPANGARERKRAARRPPACVHRVRRGYLIIAIHGSPMSRNAAMKMTPKTAPRIQKSLAGR